MARPKGIIKLGGTINELSFYKRLGKEIVRTPGGPSSKQVGTRKSCQRNRENLDEFLHGAVHSSKIFRISLNGMKHLWHPDASGMLNKLFRHMIEHTPGVRGQRPVQVLTHKEMLKGFLFHPELSFDAIVKCSYSCSVNGDRNRSEISIPPSGSAPFTDVPSGATHYRFLFAISALSEYAFVKTREKYEATDKVADGLCHLAASDFIATNRPAPALSLTTSFSPAVVPASTTAVILSLGVEFYQEVNGVNYRLKQKGCMKVVEVW
jgi:hypothetical protein